jgi:hypothetical protein
MHKILALWATPRSTSTAFEWMMRMRGDMTCFHEPFGEAWYQGEDARWPRIKPENPRIEGLTTDSVWQTLQQAAAEGPVFSKDFPHYIEHMWSDDFLGHFNHSFLIRDPAKVATSIESARRCRGLLQSGRYSLYRGCAQLEARGAPRSELV